MTARPVNPFAERPEPPETDPASIDVGPGPGRHRGRGRLDGCFGGCTMIGCPRCGAQVCTRQGLHDCRPPYVGRRRRPTEGWSTTEIVDYCWTADLAVWQARAAEWTDTRIDGDILEWRGLVLGEETGEVLEAVLALIVSVGRTQRALLKAQQDIRGGREHWLAELRKETGDAFFCLVSLAHRAGFPIADAVNDRWAVLAKRTRETEQAPR